MLGLYCLKEKKMNGNVEATDEKEREKMFKSVCVKREKRTNRVHRKHIGNETLIITINNYRYYN